MASDEHVERAWAALNRFIEEHDLPSSTRWLNHDRGPVSLMQFRVEIGTERAFAAWLLAAGGASLTCVEGGKTWRELSTVVGGFKVRVVTDHVPVVSA